MNVYKTLRQPEFDKRRNARSLQMFRESRTLDIARPFPEWRLPLKPDWHENPYGDDTWGLYYHTLGWLVILDYGVEVLDSPEEQRALFDDLKGLFFSYLRFLDETPRTETPKMAWFDHSVAWRASAIAYLVDKHFLKGLSEDESELVDRVVGAHVTILKEFIASERWIANNHGLFHAEGLWDLTRVFERLDQSISETALRHMRSVLSNMIDFNEGVCREQSIYYHLFDATLLAQSSQFMAQHKIELIPDQKAILSRMLQFYSDFCFGSSPIHCVGDTQYGKSTETRLLNEIMEAAGCANMPSPGACHQLVSYPDNGYHFFRTSSAEPCGSVSAMLIDKPYMGAHGHSDGGSLLASVNGQPFLVDSGGPFAYGKDLRFNYFKASEAHNVVLFGRRSSSYLTALTGREDGALGSFVRLESRGLEAGMWHRTLAFSKYGTMVLIDRFRLKSRAKIDALFHADPLIDIESFDNNYFRLWHGDNSLDVHCFSNAQLEIVRGGKNDTFPRGMITRELGKWEPAPVVSARLEAQEAWLVTVLSPGGCTVRPTVLSVYGGKMIRVMLDQPHPMTIDCNIEDFSATVKFYSHRPH